MTPLTNRDLLGRVLRAGSAIAAIYSFLYYLLPATTGLNLVALLNLTLASASAMLMNTIGFAVTQSDSLLTFRSASVVVTNECNGVGAWLLIVGGMAALPSISWRWRLVGIAASAVIVSVVNITRIAMLCYLQAERPSWFGPFHEQIAPLFVVMTACACFTLWLRGLEYA